MWIWEMGLGERDRLLRYICTYLGHFKNDFKHGEGILSIKSGEVFKGIFSEGKELKGFLYTK